MDASVVRRKRNDQGTTRKAQRAREVGREGIKDTCKNSIVRVDAVAGGVESSTVRS